MNNAVRQNILIKFSRIEVHNVPFLSGLFSVFGTIVLSLISSHSFATLQVSENTQTSAYECTQVELDGVSKDLLTKEERIALLDQSLSESIDSYSTCVNTAAQNMSGGGAGQGAGQGAGSSQDGSDASQNGLAGDNGDQTNAQNAPQNQGLPTADNQQGSQTNEQIMNNSQGKGLTAAARGIIPPADNDKIICKLLYQEITKTQDPDMIEGLRRQYSNYKCGN